MHHKTWITGRALLSFSVSSTTMTPFLKKQRKEKTLYTYPLLFVLQLGGFYLSKKPLIHHEIPKQETRVCEYLRQQAYHLLNPMWTRNTRKKKKESGMLGEHKFPKGNVWSYCFSYCYYPWPSLQVARLRFIKIRHSRRGFGKHLEIS